MKKHLLVLVALAVFIGLSQGAMAAGAGGGTGGHPPNSGPSVSR